MIAFALLGFLSPSNRGALGTVIIIFYTLFGFFGGYTAARTYKFFHGESWKLCFFYTPVALPAIVFGVFFLMNLFVWGSRRIRCCSIYYYACGRHYLVRHLSATECRWFLDWVQASGYRATRPHEPDPKTNPAGRRLSTTSSLHGISWCTPLWRYLCRTLFHHELHLVLESLLHVRLPIHLLRAHDHHLGGGHCVDDLLFALRRGLPLAMEVFLHGWCKRSVRVCQLLAILDQGCKLD